MSQDRVIVYQIIKGLKNPQHFYKKHTQLLVWAFLFLMLSGVATAFFLSRSYFESAKVQVETDDQEKILQNYRDTRTLIFVSLAVYLFLLSALFLLIRFFSESIRSLKEQSIDAVLSERNQVKAIVDNVQFGLMRTDSQGLIQPGYSLSCAILLSRDPTQSLAGQTLWKILSLSLRDSANFQGLYEQVFELPFLADEMVMQIPGSFTLNNRVLAFRYYPIREGERIESVLISFADVSRSTQTERDNKANVALLRILHNRGRFMGLAQDILKADDTILAPCASIHGDENYADGLRNIRRIVHAWKGNLDTFGLSEIATFVHTIEDNLSENLIASQSRELMHILKSMLNDYLKKHHAILKVSQDRMTETLISIPETDLQNLLMKVDSSRSMAEAAAHVRAFISEETMERGEDILAYLSTAAMEVAQRQEKSLKIDTRGGSLALPREYRILFSSLIHIVRNAVDHGIEKPAKRGHKSCLLYTSGRSAQGEGETSQEAALAIGSLVMPDHVFRRFVGDNWPALKKFVLDVAYPQGGHEELTEFLRSADHLDLLILASSGKGLSESYLTQHYGQSRLPHLYDLIEAGLLVSKNGHWIFEGQIGKMCIRDRL